MRLKNKISILILLIWGTIALVFYFGSHKIILSTFVKLENQTTIENLNRTQAALDQMINAIETSVKDWSIWDDTYEFIQNKNSAYIKSTLALSSFQSTQVDIILFYDTMGKLVYSAAVNADKTATIPPPKELLEILTPKNKLIYLPEINSSEKGLLYIPSGILMVASHSIINSNGNGPVRGTLVMAKYINNTVISNISKIVKLKTKLYRIPESVKQHGIDNIYRKLLITSQDVLVPKDNLLFGYRILKSVYGRNIAILETENQRNIYNIGLGTINYYTLTVFVYSLIITFAFWYLLQYLIVKRIEKLNEHLISRESGKNRLSDIFSKLSDEVSSVASMYHQATHDPLTGLANRNLLNKAFQELKSSCGITDENKKIMLLYIDIDHFKRINDTLGRDVGDELLKTTANRLTAVLRENDIAARLGGDEFVVLLCDIEPDQIESIASRAFKSVNQPFDFANHVVYVSSSMGVCIYPDDGMEIDSLIEQADMALYHAKENGRNHYQFYSESLHVSLNESHHKEIELQNALDNKELCLYYQPIYNLRTKQISSLEALIRWNHPEKGLLGADEIIPFAERTDLIHPIGEWVLKAACAQLKEWQDKGLPIVPVAVNIASAQMRHGSLSESIISALHSSSLDSHLLEIEITETGFIDITPKLLKELEGLRANGIKLTIDDFGTGYSGLGYLKKLPVSKLKIDQSFIRDIQSDPDDKAITLAIIAIAHQLNLKVTAEGVENLEQYNFMCYHQVDEVQGFLLSPPLSADKCEKLLSGEEPIPDPDQTQE